MTPEGQATINQGFGAVYKKVPGAYSVALRTIKLNDFSKQKVNDYIAYWNSLFRK
jgi:hypothetical protein